MNFMIRNNVIYNMAAGGIIIDSDDTSGQKFVANNINIYNNIIEKTNTGNSGILIADGRGTISGVKIKNNIFIKVERGVTIWPAGHNVTGVEFTNNNVYGGNNYTYDYGRRGFTKVQKNYNFAPDIKASSSRPRPYYEAKSSAANIIDKGTDVGLPYSGGAPDIGAYEYIDQLGNAPDSVRIEQ